MADRILNCVWFDKGEARKAAEFYASIFPDSGDSVEGWNLFVTDPAGTSTLGPGNHTLTLDVTGGDGCVEIDVVTLKPDGVAAWQ